jgi:hypothetical protein
MSGERVIASPMPGQPGVKYEPYVSVIRHSNPAYVFDVTREGIVDGGFRRALREAKIPYRVIVSGAYAAVLPKTPIPRSR